MVEALIPFARASSANSRFHASKPPGVLPHWAASALTLRHASIIAARVAAPSSLPLVIRNSLYAVRWPHRPMRPTISFGRNVVRRRRRRLDALFDLAQRGKGGLDRIVRHVTQNIDCNCVGEPVEIIHEPTALSGQEQPVGAPVLGIVPTLQQTVLNQTVEQPYQRDRLQLEHVCEIDLGQALLLTQPKKHDPLRARGTSLLGSVIDIVAQEPRALVELRNKLASQIER